MSDATLLKANTKKDARLTSDQMVVNILILTTIGLFLIAGAVSIQRDNPIAVWSLAVSALVTAGATLLARRGHATLGRILIPSLLTFVVTIIAYNRYGLYHISISGLPVIVVLAGLLLGIRGAFTFALLGSIAAAGLGYADVNGISPFSATTQTGYDDIVVATVLLFLTAGVLRLIIQRLTDSLHEAEAYTQAQEVANRELQDLQKELEQRVQQRTNELQGTVEQLQTISQVSQTISGIQNLEELLPRVAELISQRFEIYHTGIFLVDDRSEYAVLQAANSEGGQNMLARGHRLAIGTQGIVGYATFTGEARIALDVGEDAVYFDNPDLPDTRSEIALPLNVAGRTFGALDLQSTQPNAFNDEDIQTLSILANQVAIAIQNARSFEQSRRAAENAEIAYRQMTDQTWRRTSAQKKVLGYEYDGIITKPITKVSGDESFLNIPLLLRGQTIGKIKLDALGPDRTWTDDEIAIAQAAADRTALTLETARLLEEAQRQAAKEQTISEGTSRVSAALDMVSVLQAAAEELERALNSSEVVIQLEGEE